MSIMPHTSRKRTIINIVVIAVIGLIATGLYSVRLSHGGKADDAADQTAASSAVDPGSPQAAASAATVTFGKDGAVSSRQLTIARGTVVTWRNDDDQPHAVEPLPDQKGPHSPQLQPGDSFGYSYQEAGSFDYRDVLNPDMRATVVVKNPN